MFTGIKIKMKTDIECDKCYECNKKMLQKM